jgi:hypothetical protein
VIRDHEAGYTIGEARYARGQKIVHCVPDGSGWKTRAMRLLCALNFRYTNRERGYIGSPTKVAKFVALYVKGADATYSGEIEVSP